MEEEPVERVTTHHRSVGKEGCRGRDGGMKGRGGCVGGGGGALGTGATVWTAAG